MKLFTTLVAIMTLVGWCSLSAEPPRRKKGDSRPSQKAGEVQGKNDEQATLIPWKDLMGQRMTVVGEGANYKIGAKVRCKGFTISVDLADNHWPQEIYTRNDQGEVVMKTVKVTGKLEQWSDVPVFTPSQNRGQQGVPVPEGTDLKEARKRYVLVDVKWEIVSDKTKLTTREDLVKMAEKLSEK